jgi:hypothetical protein
VDWFGPGAFIQDNTTDYTNVPVGAVAHTNEPGFSLIGPGYLKDWNEGDLFIFCAWCNRKTESFLPIGDPFVMK